MGKEHAGHFERKVDGQRWLDEVTAATVTGHYVDPKAGLITFARYFADWSQRQIWATGTGKAMRLAAGCVTFADVPLKALRRSHIEARVKAMQTRGLAPGTVKTRVQNVRTVLRAAVRDRVMAADPSEGVTLPRARRAEAAMVLPTPDQVRALLDAAPAWFRVFIALAAFAGLRWARPPASSSATSTSCGACCGWPGRSSAARAGRSRSRRRSTVANVTVFLAVALVELLSVHAAAVVEKAPRRLFLGEGDDPPHQNTIGYWWRRTCRLAGVEGVTLHDLRHFYASGLIAAGCDVVNVQMPSATRRPPRRSTRTRISGRRRRTAPARRRTR